MDLRADVIEISILLDRYEDQHPLQPVIASLRQSAQKEDGLQDLVNRVDEVFHYISSTYQVLKSEQGNYQVKFSFSDDDYRTRVIDLFVKIDGFKLDKAWQLPENGLHFSSNQTRNWAGFRNEPDNEYFDAVMQKLQMRQVNL